MAEMLIWACSRIIKKQAQNLYGKNNVSDYMEWTKYVSILCAYLQSFDLHCFEDHYGKQRFSNFFQNYFLPMQVQKEIIYLKALISDYMVCTYLGKVRHYQELATPIFFETEYLCLPWRQDSQYWVSIG